MPTQQCMAPVQHLQPAPARSDLCTAALVGMAAGVCVLGLTLSGPSTTMLHSIIVPKTAATFSTHAAVTWPPTAPLHTSMGEEPVLYTSADDPVEDAFYQAVAMPEAPATNPAGWWFAAISSTTAALFSLSSLLVYRQWLANIEAGIAAYEAKLDSRAWRMAQVVGEMSASTGPTTLRVVDASGASAGEQMINLKTAGMNSKGLVHKKLVAELANRRQANAHTKTRAEVSGGGKKPYAQKGTGNARRGSSRSPLLRGGGVSFGPRNDRNFKQKINRKEGQLAISSLIQNRASIITVVNGLDSAITQPGTKQAKAMVESLKQPDSGHKVLIVVDNTDTFDTADPLYLSVRNIPNVRFKQQKQLNVADLLWPHQILVSDKAMTGICGRYGA